MGAWMFPGASSCRDARLAARGALGFEFALGSWPLGTGPVDLEGVVVASLVHDLELPVNERPGIAVRLCSKDDCEDRRCCGFSPRTEGGACPLEESELGGHGGTGFGRAWRLIAMC